MSEEKKGFIRQVRGCITSPRKTLESVSDDSLGRGIILVLIMVVLSGMAGYYYGSKIQLVIPGGRMVITTLFALGGGIGVVIGWLIPTVILHIVATLLRGNGGFKRILALTGFTSIPHIFRHGIRLIDAYTISSKQLIGSMPARVAGGDFITKFISQGSRVLNVFSLWSIALIIIAVTINYNMSKWKAFLSTIIAFLMLILIRSIFSI